jgi:hypothetical protein
MFYNFPGAPGNTGYQAQANPNPLTDPRNKIPGAFPNSFPMLPGEDPGAIRGVYGTPGQGQPQPRLPLAQGFAGAVGNMAGMAGMSGMSGMEGAQLAGGPFDFIQKLMSANKSANQGKKEVTGLSPIDKINANRAREMDELRKQGLY